MRIWIRIVKIVLFLAVLFITLYILKTDLAYLILRWNRSWHDGSGI
jgi:hypothetical protein